MAIVPIASADDPRLAPYRNLKDRDLAREGDRFLAEGEHVVRRLLESDYATESVLTGRRRADAIAPAVPAHVPLYVTEDALVDALVGFEFHSGVLACGRRKPIPDLDSFMRSLTGGREDARLTLMICPEIINTENLGALIRIAAGLGADAMILGERSCDPFWRRSIRVSMGTVFRLPLRRSDDLRRDLQSLCEAWRVQTIAAVTDADAEPLDRAARPRDPDRLALMLGSESLGLHPRWLKLCDRRVTVPMHLGTDSLNVAVAAAICLYHFTRDSCERQR